MSGDNLSQILESILPLGFSQQQQDIQNVSLIVSKSLQNTRLITYVLDDQNKNQHLVDLLISVLKYWMSDPYLSADFYITQIVIEMLDMLIYSRRFWQQFKSSEALNIFIKAQQRIKNDQSNVAMRTKALKIIKNLSLVNHN